MVVTADPFRFIVTKQLDVVQARPTDILIEPFGRNTAPAAAVAALRVMQGDPDGLMVLVPSDHAISDARQFRQAVRAGVPAALDGQIVTFGIVPTRAETGYGWIEAGTQTYPDTKTLVRFTEKPDAPQAQAFLKDPNYLWNAGVFLTKSRVLIDAYAAYAPDILAAARQALEDAQMDLGFTRLDQNAWQAMPDLSIDYAIMEKADNMAVVPFDGQWSDLGSWGSVWQESEKDNDGNALSENATVLDCENTLLRSEADDIELVGIGLKNVVAVAMRDAVMVADISEAQNVKQAVTVLKEKQTRQADQLPIDHRPWGWFETLVLGDRFQVKRIHVHPGASLSLQSHVHRSEHWIVVAGTARATVGETTKLLSENESIYVPLGVPHRLENPGKVPMVLIEVQTGSYLGEDDIVRYDDAYARK